MQRALLLAVLGCAVAWLLFLAVQVHLAQTELKELRALCDSIRTNSILSAAKSFIGKQTRHYEARQLEEETAEEEAEEEAKEEEAEEEAEEEERKTNKVEWQKGEEEEEEEGSEKVTDHSDNDERIQEIFDDESTDDELQALETLTDEGEEEAPP